MDPYKMVIACTNQKGGCAKTTTAVNLATSLAEGNPSRGIEPAKVLLVDLDPQGNASTSFGVDKSKLGRTVYDLLMNDLGEELPILDEYLISPEILTDSMREAWKNQHRYDKMEGRKRRKYLKTSKLRIYGYFLPTFNYQVLKLSWPLESVEKLG